MFASHIINILFYIFNKPTNSILLCIQLSDILYSLSESLFLKHFQALFHVIDSLFDLLKQTNQVIQILTHAHLHSEVVYTESFSAFPSNSVILPLRTTGAEKCGSTSHPGMSRMKTSGVSSALRQQLLHLLQQWDTRRGDSLRINLDFHEEEFVLDHSLSRNINDSPRHSGIYECKFVVDLWVQSAAFSPLPWSGGQISYLRMF